LDNCSQPDRVRFHILWTDLSPHHLRELERSWSDRLSVCNFYYLPDYIGERASVPNYGYWFWTWLGHILPEEIDLVLNLDCDVMVRGDICELWSIPLQGRIAGVVWDPCGRAHGYLTELSALGRKVGLELNENSGYFNSGVVFVDLVQWRRERIPERLDEFFASHRRSLGRFHDQTELNLLLQGRVYSLSPAWNLIEPLEFYEKWDFELYEDLERPERYFQAKVYHFAGSHKPSSHLVRGALKREFYHYLDRTEHAGWRSQNDRSPFGRVAAELLQLHYVVVRGYKQRVLPEAGKELRSVLYRAPYLVLLYPLIPIYRWFRKLAALFQRSA
jgi:lipopolysaccharide biosynthesis glycosyltransferase